MSLCYVVSYELHAYYKIEMKKLVTSKYFTIFSWILFLI